VIGARYHLKHVTIYGQILEARYNGIGNCPIRNTSDSADTDRGGPRRAPRIPASFVQYLRHIVHALLNTLRSVCNQAILAHCVSGWNKTIDAISSIAHLRLSIEV
jgi:hypothetical protein